MKVRICHQVLDNGKLCQAIALRGHLHCRHHHETTKRQMRMAWARARVALRVAEERQSGIRIPLVKKGPKSVPAPPVSLMESLG